MPILGKRLNTFSAPQERSITLDRPPTRCQIWWSLTIVSVGSTTRWLHAFRSSRQSFGWGRSKGKRAAAPATRRPARAPVPRPRPHFTCSPLEPLPEEAPFSPGPVLIVDPSHSLPSVWGFWVDPSQLFRRQRHVRCSGCQVEVKRMGGRGRRVSAVLVRGPAAEESTEGTPALQRVGRGDAATAGAAAAGRGAADGRAAAEPPPPCCTSVGAGRALRLPRRRLQQRLATLHLLVRCHTIRFHTCSALPFHPVKRMYAICTI